MARKLRLEFPGALYHVINRGNYRADVFAAERTKEAFAACVFEACAKADWRLHAYVIMRNHYHLAIETPNGNLVEGMRWLQSTFANRFNRLRREQGHVFQGRYKARWWRTSPGSARWGITCISIPCARAWCRRRGWLTTGTAASPT
jgi:putative transposase